MERTDQQSGRRSILVVDGDDQIQKLLDLSLRNAGFDVKTVATAPEALTWLEKQRPDLVVAETRLAGATDGFELCRKIKGRSDGAQIAFVFLSEQTVESRMRGVEAGADDFLPKPLYVQEVVEHARSLLRRRERERLETVARGEETFRGELADFPLVDLLRSIEHNHKSGVVTLSAPGGARGEIYFREGVVVDAEVGRLSGLDAVCRLFAWAEASFEIEWKSIRRRDVVAMAPGALLIEALRRLDEWRRLLLDVPPLETQFEVDYHLLAERLAEIPDEVNSILRLFDGQRTFIQVIDDCGLSDLDALAVIGKLYREEIIRDVRARPAPTNAPGAELEGWIADATGPFRALTTRPRRDLFGAAPDASGSSGLHRLHSHVTAPVEPLEENGKVAAVEDRRERFTDRLIAEGAVAAAAPPAPTVPTAAPPARKSAPVMDALEKTQQGLGLRPPMPVMDPLEKTHQGLGLTMPALSTKPGFQAVTPAAAAAPPAQRVARNVLTDITSSAEGVPQLVPPQSPEPAIIVPGAPPAPPPAAAPPEQRPVAGEIVSRPPTVRGMESALATSASAQAAAAAISIDSPRVTAPDGSRAAAAPVGGEVKRITDLGLGPVAPARKKVDERGPTQAAGEVIAIAGHVEEARPAGRKIILDPALPEDEGSAGGARWTKWAGIGVGLALAVGAVWFVFKNTGHKRRHEVVVATAEKAPETKPVIEPVAGTAPAAAGDARVLDERADPKVARATLAQIDDRWADPKVARALPAEFPTLLGACRQAFTEKRARDAEIACTAAKDANPESAEANSLQGHALFGRKKRKEALQAAERAVELDPKQADAYVIIGGVKQATGDKAAAKAAYKKYLELAPNGQYAADLRAIVEAP
jgi:DNA-binding response OmpR family regulator